jgi:amino acid adenylation domain-containing protein/non-ribosomal peptide synthase protein (TIGR01720 family)
LSGEEARRHRQYWLEQFAGEVPALELPTDYPRPSVKSYRGGRVGEVIPAELTGELGRIAREAGASLFMLLLSAVNALLYRYSGQDDIVVGTPIAGRNHGDLEDQIGFYVNTLALRTSLRADERFTELLERVKGRTLEAYEHQVYPFDRLVEDLSLKRDVSRSALLDVMVVLQNTEPVGLDARSVEGIEVEVLERRHEVSKFDLTFNFREVKGGLLIRIEYSSELFRRESVERMLGHLRALLQGIAANPAQRVGRLPLLSEAEQRQVLEGWNQGGVEYAEQYAHRLFEAQAEKTPHAVAVTFRDRQLTYAELNERANRLAHHLGRLGVGPESCVGLCVERSLEMVVGILGTLKAGGAYVPLDPTYPPERLAFMLKDARASVILTQTWMREKLRGQGPRVVCLDDGGEELETYPKGNPAPALSRHNTAYVIYTSGSTGQPKGVLVTHDNLARLFSSTRELFNFSASDVWTLFHSYAFDFSVWELWGALLYGGRVVVVPYRTSRSPEAFYRLLSDEGVTVLNQTPSAFRQLSMYEGSLSERPGLSLRLVIFGGEALEAQSLVPWVGRHGAEHPSLVNMYGITETTVHVTHHLLRAEDFKEGRGSVVGRPLEDLRVYILDARMEPVPVGVRGEMYVGGGGLARGYLHRPTLTAGRFVPDPFGGEAGARLYRTGDLARYLDGGDIEYLGRSDDQVKVRGFRIELREIEATLNAHPAISECVVVVDREGDAGRLVAYAVVWARQSPTVDELRRFARQRLPDYMLPAVFVFLKALPLTPQGKLDRRALPSPDSQRPEMESVFVAPRNRVEASLASVWSEALGVKQVGIEDDYFTLGGDSIRAIQVAARLRVEGFEIQVTDLFKHPTIAALAPHVKESGRAAEQYAVGGPIPLSPMQEWFLSTTPPERRHEYNQGVMLYTPRPCDRAALEAVFAGLSEHHDALRARLRADTHALVLDDARAHVPLQEYDLRQPGDAPTELRRKAAELQASIDAETGPLMRCALFHLPDGDRLLIVVHRLLIDSASWPILLGDLETLYGQYAEGRPLSLPVKTGTLKAWAEQLAAYADGDALLKDESYPATLEATDVPVIPRDGDAAETHSADEAESSFTLDEEETARLLTDANVAFGTEPEDLLLSALAVAVRAVYGHTKVAVMLEGDGREAASQGSDFSRTVGWFAYTYPLTLNAGDPSDLSRQIKETKEARRKTSLSGLSYAVLKCLTKAVHRGEAQSTLEPQLSFSYRGRANSAGGAYSFEITHDSADILKSAEVGRAHELAFVCTIAGGRLSVAVNFSERQYRTATVEKLLGQYRSALRNVIAHCTARETAEPTPSDFTYKGLSLDAIDTLLDF